MIARFRLPPWLFLLVLAAIVAALLYSIDLYRHRVVRSHGDLVRLLPPEDSTIFFVNFSVLRKAGMMHLVSSAKPAEEKDYDNFVRQTHFSYGSDIDALAAAVGSNGMFFVARGRFDWDRLQRYAISHGGSCQSNELCRVQTSRPGYWASFLAIQPDVIALAIARDSSAAKILRSPGRRYSQPEINAPVWVDVSRELLKDPGQMLPPLRIFAITLQSADAVIVSLGPPEENDPAAFEIRLNAVCPNSVTADTIRTQLELQTKLLRLELIREHRQPNPADLTGLMTSGSFQVAGRRVVGMWPVRNELLKTLQ
jgi:hypothetical protein